MKKISFIFAAKRVKSKSNLLHFRASKKSRFVEFIVGVLTLSVIIGVLAFGGVISFQDAVAESSDNVSGFAWSENIGWISFNCRNQELSEPRCASTDYGVNIEDDGDFTGYAWSEHIGWVDFAPSGPYPNNPQYSVRTDTADGQLTGWARALNYGSGWDGWIKIYSASIDTSTGVFSGWAWGSDVVGWVDLAGSGDGMETTFPFNHDPVVSNLSVDQGDYCVLAFQPRFYWDFDDEDVGDSQNSYQVQIDDDSDIAASPLIDSCVPSLGTCGDGYTAQSYTPASPSSFDYNTTYYWRIKAWDNRGGESEWVESQFTTIEHETPDIDFTWTPLRPSRGEFAQFCATVEAGVCVSDVSKCYNALGQQISCSGNIFAWTFPPGTEFSTTTTAASENPQVNFPASGWQVVSLRINDGVGNCIATKDVRVAAPLPKWQETAP